MNGDIVWCKYPGSPWWPAIIVPARLIADDVIIKKKVPNQICVYFFASYNFGWVFQTQLCFYIKGVANFEGRINQHLQNAVAEAEHFKKRFDEINEKICKQINNSEIYSPYKYIKKNRLVATFPKGEYTKCECSPEDQSPCSSLNSNCLNALLNIECDPLLCQAKSKCQNQNFHYGEKFKFKIEMTDLKGWGLFATEEIFSGAFVIEYRGEVIDKVELKKRQAISHEKNNVYFIFLGNDMFIDATLYGNEARFINHSCYPNVAPKKWTIYSNGYEH